MKALTFTEQMAKVKMAELLPRENVSVHHNTETNHVTEQCLYYLPLSTTIMDNSGGFYFNIRVIYTT